MNGDSEKTILLQSIWPNLRKPSRRTMKALEAAGAKVDYWQDYQPRARHKKVGAIDLNRLPPFKEPV